MSAPVQPSQPSTPDLNDPRLWDRIRKLEHDNNQAAARIEVLEAALRFYADPFAWKKRHDPGDDIRVPDFYSETSFGDTAIAALPKQEPGA